MTMPFTQVHMACSNHTHMHAMGHITQRRCGTSRAWRTLRDVPSCSLRCGLLLLVKDLPRHTIR
jgi:hypothetical protein